MGRAVAALRRAAVRRSLRAGDPLCARRLRRVAGRRREMGEGRRKCCRTTSALPSISCRAAARRSRANCSAASRWRARSRASPPRAATRSIAASSRRRWSRMRRRTARCTRSPISPTTRVDWVEPLALDFAATTVHEIPPNGQGIAALMALGILRAFDLDSLAPDSVESQHLQIEAMKLAFADAYRYVSDPRTMEFTPAALLDPDYLASRARLIDPQARAGLRPRRSAARRHRLPLRGRRARHDRVADPVELHGLRIRRRRAGHRHQPAESRRRIFARRPAIRTRSAAASVRSRRSSPDFSRATARRSAPSASWAARSSRPGHVQTMVRLLVYGMNPQAVLDAPRWKLERRHIGRPRRRAPRRSCARA